MFDLAFPGLLWTLAAIRGFDAFALVLAIGWTPRIAFIEPMWRRRHD